MRANFIFENFHRLGFTLLADMLVEKRDRSQDFIVKNVDDRLLRRQLAGSSQEGTVVRSLSQTPPNPQNAHIS